MKRRMPAWTRTALAAALIAPLAYAAWGAGAARERDRRLEELCAEGLLLTRAEFERPLAPSAVEVHGRLEALHELLEASGPEDRSPRFEGYEIFGDWSAEERQRVAQWTESLDEAFRLADELLASPACAEVLRDHQPTYTP